MTKYILGEAQPETPEPLPVDKGVPIPEFVSPFVRSSTLTATARTMVVGDSFVVPYRRTSFAHNMERATGFKFTQRREGDFMRIWRIK